MEEQAEARAQFVEHLKTQPAEQRSSLVVAHVISGPPREANSDVWASFCGGQTPGSGESSGDRSPTGACKVLQDSVERGLQQIPRAEQQGRRCTVHILARSSSAPGRGAKALSIGELTARSGAMVSQDFVLAVMLYLTIRRRPGCPMDACTSVGMLPSIQSCT
jgi:hypothetical protein